MIRYRTIKRRDVAEIQRVARRVWMHTYRETVPVTLINRFLSDRYFGKDIGKALLKLGEQFFRKKNARKYYVNVYSKNKRALDFYSRNGLERIEEKDKKPELYLEKSLD